MTVFLLGFQWISWRENGSRRRYSARRWRHLNWSEDFLRHGVEAPFLVEQSVGGEDMKVRMEDEVIAEGVDGGGGDATAGQTEAGAEGVAQAFGRGLEKEVEEVAAFAEDAAQHFRKGEHELAVRNVVADGGGDPYAGLTDAALVTGGAEVARLAGEGEELFVAAIGAMNAGEAGGEIAAPEKGADGGDGIGAQRSHGAAVMLFVAGDEIVPSVVDDLTTSMQRGFARQESRSTRRRIATEARRAGGAVGRWRARVPVGTDFEPLGSGTLLETNSNSATDSAGHVLSSSAAPQMPRGTAVPVVKHPMA
jgi:hypothetical protein